MARVGLDATPFGAFVKFVKECQSVAEVESRRTSLMTDH
jgi:hypothetical protein